MTSYQVEHSVPVTIVYHGRPEPASVAVSIENGNGRRIFGLVDAHDPERLTLMSYDLGTFDGRVIIDAMRAEGVEWWRFLATGNDLHDIKISIRELEVALYRLKLINRIGGDE
jgi:hypothetical protein